MVDLVDPPTHVRMKHPEKGTTLSIAAGPPDATGGQMIPYARLEEALGHGFYIAHDDSEVNAPGASIATEAPLVAAVADAPEAEVAAEEQPAAAVDDPATEEPTEENTRPASAPEPTVRKRPGR